jgi:hypothetical protein
MIDDDNDGNDDENENGGQEDHRTNDRDKYQNDNKTVVPQYPKVTLVRSQYCGRNMLYERVLKTLLAK